MSKNYLEYHRTKKRKEEQQRKTAAYLAFKATRNSIKTNLFKEVFKDRNTGDKFYLTLADIWAIFFRG